MAWISVCSVEDVPDGEGRRFDFDPPLAIFRIGDEFFAADDLCTHGESSLAEGYLDSNCAVECLAHMAKFSLRTGEVLAPPASRPVRVFSARVDGSTVMVDHHG